MSSFPTRADVETASDDYAKRFGGRVGAYFLQKQADIVLNYLKSENISTILDMGGGHSQLAKPLIKAGYNVTVTGSCDVCENRLKKELPQNSYKYLTCDLLNHPLPDASFDAVISFRFLPHEDDWKLAIKEMSRLSKQIIIVDYPDIRSFNVLSSSLFALKKNYEGNTRDFITFSRSQIKNVFREFGFTSHRLSPQYFFPMVLHRLLKSVKTTKALEWFPRVLGLTSIFGTPIIFAAKK